MKPVMLLLSAMPPFPADSGGATRMYYTIKYLSRKYELYFLSFGEEIVDEEQQQFLNEHCAHWRIFARRRRTPLSSLPYPFSCWKSGKFERYIGKILDEHPVERIRIEFGQLAYLWQYLPRTTPKTLVAHDICAVTYERRAQESKKNATDIVSLIRAGTDYANSVEIRAYEKLWLPLFDEVVAVSAHDREILRRDFGISNVRLEPNGIESIALKTPTVGSELVCGYIGSPYHLPNKQAIDFTTEKILPLLDEQGPSYRYLLAGSHHQTPESKHIQVLGQVASSRSFFEKIDVLVAPLFAGSGTRVKILESLACGVPVITTPVGAEGLNIHSEYLQIIDEAEPEKCAQAFARAIRQLPEKIDMLREEAVRQELTKQLQRYLWERTFAAS